MKASKAFEQVTCFDKAIKNLKKASKKELRHIIKFAESEIEEYDKLINTIKKELRGREK